MDGAQSFPKVSQHSTGTCEQSIFCNEDIVGDVMSGLKTFVVKFMIRMSKVCVRVCTVYMLVGIVIFYLQDFATSSLRGEVATENEEQVHLDILEEYTIAERKEWEKRYVVLYVLLSLH